ISAELSPSMWRQLSSPFERFFVFSYLYCSLLVSIRLGLVQTGSVCEWGSGAPHWPCGCLRLLCTACSPLSMTLASCPYSEDALWTRDTAGRLSLLWALHVLCAAGFVTRGTPSPQTTFYPCRQRLPPSTQSCMRSEAPGEAPR